MELVDRREAQADTRNNRSSHRRAQRYRGRNWWTLFAGVARTGSPVSLLRRSSRHLQHWSKGSWSLQVDSQVLTARAPRFYRLLDVGFDFPDAKCPSQTAWNHGAPNYLLHHLAIVEGNHSICRVKAQGWESLPIALLRLTLPASDQAATADTFHRRCQAYQGVPGEDGLLPVIRTAKLDDQEAYRRGHEWNSHGGLVLPDVAVQRWCSLQQVPGH